MGFTLISACLSGLRVLNLAAKPGVAFLVAVTLIFEESIFSFNEIKQQQKFSATTTHTNVRYQFFYGNVFDDSNYGLVSKFRARP